MQKRNEMKSRDLISSSIIKADRVRLPYFIHEISPLLPQLPDSVEMTADLCFEAELQKLLCSQAERGNKRDKFVRTGAGTLARASQKSS